MTKISKYQTLDENVLVGGNVILKYSTLPSNVPEERIKDLLKRGLIKKITLKEAKTLDTENQETKRILDEAKKEKLKPDKNKKRRLNRVGRWNINPRTLVGKTLDQLNIMIAERDPKVGRYETIPEAVGQLTKDFRGD